MGDFSHRLPFSNVPFSNLTNVHSLPIGRKSTPASIVLEHIFSWAITSMNSNPQSTLSFYEQRAAVCELLSEALSQDIERRSQQREPLLAMALIQTDRETDRWLTGLTRDVSDEGIGLMHSFPLDECTEVVVKISYAKRRSVLLEVMIEWCEPIGEGWYISGGRFTARP